MSDKSCRLFPPKLPNRPTSLATLTGALATRFNSKVGIIKQQLEKAIIEEWGKVQRIDSDAGDTMVSSSLRAMQDDSHDATFVRVSDLSILSADMKSPLAVQDACGC
jgi:hypothetical protein